MWCFHGMTIKKDGWMIAILEVTFYYHFLLANTDFVREKWWKVLLLFTGLIIAFLYRKIFSQWLMDLKWLTVWQIFELQVKPFIKVIDKFYIWICFLLKLLSLFLGMLKDVEDDVQRRVKVYFLSLFFSIGYLYSSKCQVNFS